ncbi:MAG: PEP-CTERM sorting domain-containing protein [Planctomycetota bacterium]
MGMNRTWMILTFSFAALIAAKKANAELLISNIEISPTTLTFHLSGTIGVGEINTDADDPFILFIGEPDNSDWYVPTGTTYLAAEWTPNLTNDSPDLVDFIAPAVNQDATFGDYILLIKDGAIAFAPGDVIDGTFSATNGSFNRDDTDPTKWIVSAGNVNSPHPDPLTKIGSAVPEPSSISLVLVAFTALMKRRRR